MTTDAIFIADLSDVLFTFAKVTSGTLNINQFWHSWCGPIRWLNSQAKMNPFTIKTRFDFENFLHTLNIFLGD